MTIMDIIQVFREPGIRLLEDDGDVDFAHMIETEMMKKEVMRLNRQLECAEREGELWHKK